MPLGLAASRFRVVTRRATFTKFPMSRRSASENNTRATSGDFLEVLPRGRQLGAGEGAAIARLRALSPLCDAQEGFLADVVSLLRCVAQGMVRILTRSRCRSRFDTMPRSEAEDVMVASSGATFRRPPLL